MTFKRMFLGGLLFLLSQGAMASKQVISCDQDVNFVLFGIQSAYGELFTSGLMESPLGRNSSQVTLSSRSRPNEEDRNESLFAGTDYDGNTVIVDLPKAAVGKSVVQAFSAMAKIVEAETKKETTLEINCISEVVE